MLRSPLKIKCYQMISKIPHFPDDHLPQQENYLPVFSKEKTVSVSKTSSHHVPVNKLVQSLLFTLLVP